MADAEDGAEEAAMEPSAPTPRSASGSVEGSIRSLTKSRETSKSGASAARSLPAEGNISSKDLENTSIRSSTKSRETSKSGERSPPAEESASSKDVENRSIDIVKSQEESSPSKTMDEMIGDEASRQSVGSEEKSQEDRRDSDASKRSSEVKEIKLLPKARTSSRLTTSIQQQNQRRFREMIGKRELRNEELGKQKGDLRHRLDLLECSVPAVMLWNIWRMSQGAPISSIQRVMKKQFLGPASGEAYCPTTPSRHYDCRVREAEADRKLAEKRACEARTVLSEKQKLLDAKKQKLEEAKRTQQERQEKIEQLTKQARELKEAIKEVEQDGSCVAGECGDIECKRRLLARISSSSSIRSTDVECLEKLQQLAESELMMKRQIEDLERREETYMKTLQQADDLWAKVEGDTASTMSALQELLDVKAAKIQQLEDQLKDQLTKSAAYKTELQKYVSIEKIEAAIGRDDDLAQVYDKSIAAKVKLKHRITGGEVDMAEKEILAHMYGKDQSVSAVIAQVESSVYARPDLADLGTDIPEDLIARVQAQMGIKSEGIPPEEKYRQAILYLDQIGSLSKLYDQDDWKVCEAEQACQQFETSTEQLISVTSLASKTGESFHGTTSKDIGLAPTSQEAARDPSTVKSSSRVDVKDGKSLKSVLSGKETPKKALAKDGRGGPTEDQLRSWLDTTNDIRTVIENCPECQIATKEVDGLAKDIASYTGRKGKPQLKEDPRAETKGEIQSKKSPWQSREKVERLGKEQVRADKLKISKSDISRGPDDRELTVKDSRGTVKKPRAPIEEKYPSPKEVVELDKVPVEQATKQTAVSSEKPAVKEVSKKRGEESAPVQREVEELEEAPVEVTSAPAKDIPPAKEAKTIQEVMKVTEIAAESVTKETAEDRPIESHVDQEKIQKSKAFHEEVEEVTIKEIKEAIQESEDIPDVINIIEDTNEPTRVVIRVSSKEKPLEPPPTPIDLQARAAASVTSTPEEIASRLEEHLSATPEEFAKRSTEVSDIIDDAISEDVKAESPKLQDEMKSIVEDLIPQMLEEELEVQPEEKEVKVPKEVEVKLEELKLEEARITEEEIELEKPQISPAESELKRVQIIRVDSEPLLPKLSKVIEVEETESPQALKQMGRLLTGPEVACKPYLAIADVEIPKPEKSQPELKQPCPCNVLELGPTQRELARRDRETMEIVTQTSESVGVQTIPVQRVIKRLDVPTATTHREPPCQLRLQDQSTITVSSLGIQTDPYNRPGDFHTFDCTCCVCASRGPTQIRPEPPPKEVPLASKMPIMLLSGKVNATSLRTDQEVLRERLCTECKIKRLERQRQAPAKSPRKGSCEAGPCGRILKDMRDQSSMARIPKPTPKCRSKWKEPNTEVLSKSSSLEGCTCYDVTKKLSCKCGDPFMYEHDL